MRVEKEEGLLISEIIYNLVRDELNYFNSNAKVLVGSFTNCRECGYTFKVSYRGKRFTWCIYEHRNSDDIIINGKEGYICFNGELPYMGEDKYSYIRSFSYNQYYECAKELSRLIKEFLVGKEE